MARVHYVRKARKDQGVCDRCGNKISAGDAYKWVGLRPSGPGSHLKKKRCETCPNWRQSELSFSKMAGIYAAMESWEDFLTEAGFESVDDVQSALDEIANQVREVAEEYAESAQNIEDGFGHPVSMSEELQEKAETLESWADEIESASIPDAPDPDDFETWAEYDGPDADEVEEMDDEERDETWSAVLDAWRERVESDVSEPFDCPI